MAISVQLDEMFFGSRWAHTYQLNNGVKWGPYDIFTYTSYTVCMFYKVTAQKPVVSKGPNNSIYRG